MHVQCSALIDQALVKRNHLNVITNNNHCYQRAAIVGFTMHLELLYWGKDIAEDEEAV